MSTTLDLPYPTLDKGCFASIAAYTDVSLFEKTGVRIAFTCRGGGVSQGAYESLNLGAHVSDDFALVEENRRRVLEAFATSETTLVVPNQVHGDTLAVIESNTDIQQVLKEVTQGADGIIVNSANVATLLCFADCVPVIVVSPTRRFAVVHAGWRGVMNKITCKAIARMAKADQNVLQNAPGSYNVYIGPHIHGECFETSIELYDRFIETFGRECDAGYRHIDLAQALSTQIQQVGVGPERIVDLGLCTVCSNDEFFSYRAQDGVAGRHGAFAYCAK